MPACPACGGPIFRKPRNLIERAIDRATFKCRKCGFLMHGRRPFLAIFRRYCECPRCGTHDLGRLASKDHIDAVTRNPFRRLLGLFGCPLYHCTFCRFQFRDWRSRQSDARNKSPAATT